MIPDHIDAIKELSEAVHILINKIEDIAERQDRTDRQYEYIQTQLKTLNDRVPAQQTLPPAQPATGYTPPQPRTPNTPWQQSRNPGIEWCPEQDADPRDVADAKAKRGDMWYLPPRPPYDTGSIMRRK